MDNFWSGIIGALIGGCATLIGAYYASKEERDMRTQGELRRKKNLAQSLIAELTVLKSFISDRSKSFTEGSDIIRISITESYFDVYSGNTNNIGVFNSGCTTYLIETYMSIKSLYDNARMISIMADEIADWELSHLEDINKNISIPKHFSSSMEQTKFYIEYNRVKKIQEQANWKRENYDFFKSRVLESTIQILGAIDQTILFLESEVNLVVER